MNSMGIQQANIGLGYKIYQDCTGQLIKKETLPRQGADLGNYL